MAQNVVINGVTYSNVPSVSIPKSTSGTAEFFDTSDATLDSGAKMLSGNTAYANGTKYTGSIATKSASDITASGDTVTVPAGYYASQNTKAVAAGSAKGPTSVSGASATVSTDTNTLTLSKTVSITPVVTAGYVASGTAQNASVSLTASVTTKAAATITPTTTNQTIASGKYLTGAQTILGDANLLAENIKKDVSIFNVVGTLEGGGGGGTLCIFTMAPYANTDVVIGGHAVTPMVAYYGESVVPGATINYKSYSDYILTTVTGLDSGSTIPFTTVSRGNYTFTMPSESVYCAMLYDD